MEVTNNFSPPKKRSPTFMETQNGISRLEVHLVPGNSASLWPFWDGENVTRDPKSKAKNRNLQRTGNEMVTLHLVLRFDGRNPAPDDR